MPPRPLLPPELLLGPFHRRLALALGLTPDQLRSKCWIRLFPGDIDTWHGIGVTTPVRTCFGLMRQSSFVEAGVWADLFLHANLTTAARLAMYADERPRWSHVRKVREAAGRARARAAPPDTRPLMARGAINAPGQPHTP